LVQAFAVGAMAVGAASGVVTMMNRDIPDLAVPDGPWDPGRALDGRVFHTVDRVVGSDEILHDELRFVDGRFQSVKCQQYCDFGCSEYRTKRQGDALYFTVTTRCPDAPHTVVWYGTVEGDALRFEGTWTTRRWYWTHQIAVVGEGSAEPATGTVAEG